MEKTRCIAMILAGGRGERLGALTRYHSKPAIYFGGSYRIIDFALGNCKNSGIGAIGVLSQYFTTDLNEYMDSICGGTPEYVGIHALVSRNRETAYKGTADAVRKNLSFIRSRGPRHVLVLASDHVYKMDYRKLIDFHERNDADVTVAAVPVPMRDAGRYGILKAKRDGRVCGFEEKPREPKSNLASMGVYVFKTSVLEAYLEGAASAQLHDFGRDILPLMLKDSRFFAYRFGGYWRDVGTVDKFWEASMDQLSDPELRPYDGKRGMLPVSGECGSFISDSVSIRRSMVAGGCSVFGNVSHSTLGGCVTVGPGSEIVNSVVMPNVYIGCNVKIHNAVIGTYAAIMDNTVIGAEQGLDFFVDRKVCGGGISLVSPWLHIYKSMEICKGSHVYKEKLDDLCRLLANSDLSREAVNYIAG